MPNSKSKRWLVALFIAGALVIGALALFLAANSEAPPLAGGSDVGAQRASFSPAPATANPVPQTGAQWLRASNDKFARRAADYETDAPRKRNELGQPLPFREIPWPQSQATAFQGASEGDTVALKFFDDAGFEARVTGRWRDEAGIRIAAQLEGRGPLDRFFMSWADGYARGLVELPSINRAYEIVQSEVGGALVVREWLFTDVVCATPKQDGAAADSGIPKPVLAESPEPVESRIASADVPLLESRPGVAAVLYMDFDGEVVSGTAWAGGATINAPAARMSTAQITEVWERVSRDFAAFTVNVTTDRAVYEAAPANRRTHCVVTDDDTAAPGAGGVAYLNSFTNASSAYKICWSFIDNHARNCAVVVSHEVGHTLDLAHDGRLASGSLPREEYYRGHGSGATGWAPVMGAGYYEQLVQWSKGEYDRANNQEDDLAIITASHRIPYFPDDHAGTTAEATAISSGEAAAGLVQSTGDEDYYRVLLGSGPQPVSVTLPVGTMLDVELKIFADDGTLLQTVNPVNELPASTTLNFATPRTVFLRVAGTGKPEVSGTGYSSYSSLGSFTLTAGTGAPVNPPPTVAITSPPAGTLFDPSTGPITVTATAVDYDVEGNPGVVSKVECFANGVSQGTMVRDPVLTDTYTLTFTPPGGRVTLLVTATDNEDASASASLAIRYQYTQPGEVRSFIPPLVDGTVRALAADGDGRIYIGGEFTKLNTSVDAPRVARLLSDGSVDPDFQAGTGFDGTVRVMVFDAGRSGLYAGGNFKNAAGISRTALARLAIGMDGRADGTADPGFAPLIESSSSVVTPFVGAIAIQGDGKILIGGNFSKINNAPRAFIARLFPDGTLDQSFAPLVPGVVNAIALQPDGKILIGGTFGEVNGVQRRNLARINSDGTLDATLDVGTGSSGGFNGAVNSVAVALSGDIYVGGSFSSYNGQRFYKNLAKLSSTGSVYPNFNYLDGLDNQVYDVHLRPDGHILLSGLFTSIGNRLLGFSSLAGRVAQLNNDGTLDDTFNVEASGANGSVLDSLGLPNGDILLAGAFTAFNGTARQNLAVITGYDAAKPIVTSPSSHTTQVGTQVDFAFTANAPATFAVTGALPVGVSFDVASGRLVGIPLETGSFTVAVTPTTALGTGDPAAFLLRVEAASSPLTGFPAWIEQKFSSEELTDTSIWAPGVVLNPLGLSNFAVYALTGGDPRSVPASALPVVSRAPDGAETYLTLTAPKNPDATDVEYSVQYSADLASWSAAPADVVVISETNTEIKARAAVPASAGSRQFLRLKMLHRISTP